MWDSPPVLRLLDWTVPSEQLQGFCCMQCGILQGISPLIPLIKSDENYGSRFPEAASLMQDWNYLFKGKKGWGGETRHRTQLTSGTAEVYIFPAFFIQISMVKVFIIHQRTKSLLCFSISYLSAFSISCSLDSHAKAIVHFHVLFLAVMLLDLGIVWAKVIFFLFFLSPLVGVVCVPFILS